LPLLAIRMGKLPMPALPANAEELVRADPLPPRSKVYASVVRADELLTGMLVGTSLVTVVGSILLVGSGSVAGAVLVGVVAGASLLRARSFPTVRLRVPLLVAGLAGFSALVLGPTFDSTVRLMVVTPVLAVAAAFTAAAGLAYSRRTPSPYLGRIADILDVLLVIAIVPVACGVLGLYGYVRGIAG
jgi:type VII secretion integral membrane protein EccD